MMTHHYTFLHYLISAALSIALLTSCTMEQQTPLNQKTVGLTAQSQDIQLYNNRPLDGWQVFINNDKQRLQSFSAPSTQLADGSVKLTTTNKDGRHDALTYQFQNSRFYNLYFEGGKPLNLNAYMAKGTVEFDIRIEDFAKTALDLTVSCGQDCYSILGLRQWALKAEGKGWKHLSIPMHCFSRQSASFEQVEHPFNLKAYGKGQVSVANVSFKLNGEANFDCIAPDKLAVTPATLDEFWSVDWWMPRHYEKLAQAKLGQAELLLIGDSITHNWEKAGKEIWQQYFGDIDTLNIGFSGDRTENVLWRLHHNEVEGITPKLAIMMIGTNNTGHRMDNPASIAAGVDLILKELSERLPETKVLLLAIFPRGANNEDKNRQNNQQTNKLLKKLANTHNVMYADINQHFLTDDGILSEEIMPDLLHPNATGYSIWAEQIKPYVDKYVR